VDNSNSWYIAMHLDRLNEELLEEYGKQIEDKPQKRQKSKHITELNKKEDNLGL
jgi:hypothetical protein